MFNLKTKVSAVLAALLCAGSALAQDSGALIEALLRKGILTDQEAEDLRADLANDNTAKLASTSLTPNLAKMTISGRFQAQFVSFDTSIRGPATDPAYVNHAFLRRIYIGFKPVFSNGWSAFLNYDFAGSTFDAAYIEKIFSPAAIVQAGFKKAPIGYEEYFISSGALKSIERSALTRFFVESNNGRRLGAGSYRQGVWLLGKQGAWSYEVAVTNPEREESSAGTAGTGSAANNVFAYWANLNYQKAFAEGQGLFKAGTSYGFLPDQGSKTLGTGKDLAVWSIYADLRYRNWSILGEYMGSDNEQGVSATQDSKSNGYYLQASYRYGPYEPVVRYTFVDSDGRGVQTSDGIRSTPSGGTMNELTEWFLGVNWYIVGNEAKHEVKLQAGYLFGETRDSLTGASGPKAWTQGFRSQLQVNF
ncbi:MAG: porin [Verrucomicrobiota bacterium]